MRGKTKKAGRKRKTHAGRNATLVILLLFIFIESYFICVYLYNKYADGDGGAAAGAAFETTGAAGSASGTDSAARTDSASGTGAAAAAGSNGAAKAAGYGGGAISASASAFTADLPERVIPVRVEDIADTRLLELINSDYPIRAEPAPELLFSEWPAVPVAARDITLHVSALNAAEEMIGAAREADISSLYVSSGYRDRAAQESVYEGAEDKSYALPPDHSEHQAGLAIDILALNVPQYKMADSPEGLWLAENAWKFGLIQRYADEKREITRIAGEPWHFRYIGAPHAWYCHYNDMCYEEYIQFLEDAGGYRADLTGFTGLTGFPAYAAYPKAAGDGGDADNDGGIYAVMYVRPVNGIIYLPDNPRCEVSGDNRGGYIITAREERTGPRA